MLGVSSLSLEQFSESYHVQTVHTKISLELGHDFVRRAPQMTCVNDRTGICCSACIRLAQP